MQIKDLQNELITLGKENENLKEGLSKKPTEITRNLPEVQLILEDQKHQHEQDLEKQDKKIKKLTQDLATSQQSKKDQAIKMQLAAKEVQDANNQLKK